MKDEILFADNLNAVHGVKHAFFAKGWGKNFFSERQAEEEALADRVRITEYFGLPSTQLQCCHQVHSPEVITMEKLWPPESVPDADGMVTDKPGVALGILTADCVPVLFAAGNARVIGAAHAGWKGALGGVLDNTLMSMEKLGADRSAIQASIGPSIYKASYEVGSEFPAPFLAEDTSNERYFSASLRPGHYLFDLPGYVLGKLQKLGLNCVTGPFGDTCAEPDRFYSYRYSCLRGELRGGNQIAVIALE